jgi:hypothetical protein
LEGLGCLKNLVGGDATMLQFHHELEHARSLLPVQACELANFNINDSSSLAELRRVTDISKLVIFCLSVRFSKTGYLGRRRTQHHNAGVDLKGSDKHELSNW